VKLLHQDLRDGLPLGPFDLIVSNPPYVLSEEIDSLEPEVREWEPREALVDGGQTDALARHALDVLRPGASLVLEIHAERALQVSEMLVARGYEVRISSDLTGRDRVVVAKKRS
jgi:release factor glutamine methyltransferase